MTAPRLHLMYGGTFDPFHAGHLSIALAARDRIGAEVHVTPAADPPHRAATSATADERAGMVALAIAGFDHLHLDRRELDRAGPSYTVDTLRGLRAELGTQTPLAILVGADSFLSLPTWSRWTEILDLAHIVVAERTGQGISRSGNDALGKVLAASEVVGGPSLRERAHGAIYCLKQALHPASATAIRTAIAAGRTDWDRWLDPDVAEFIKRRHLYGYAGSMLN